jgi:hypothetical protein
MRATTRARAALVLAAVVTLLLAACGGPGSPGGSPGATGTPPGANQGIAHPTGASDLVLSVTYEGGMLRPDMTFSQLPPLTIAGDGTVILQGAQIDIFPGPALPAVQSRRLSEAGLQLILERIAGTGFFAESATFTEESLTLDAPLTVFTLHADDRDVVVKVGALGMYRTPEEMPPNMTERERQAHLTLAPLFDNLTLLDELIPASAWEETVWHDYRADSLRLLVANVDGEPADPSGIPGGVVEWPTDGDAATFGDPYPILEGARCGIVEGAEAETWYDVLSQANQLTRYSSGDHTYQVTPRPVLPGDPVECVVGQPAG